MNIIPNLPILHSKKTVGKFVFTQNYLQSQKYTLLLIKQILFIILIYYEQFIVSYKNNHILELNILKSLRCGCFYVIFITKMANIALFLYTKKL
mgnify:CR=1 FL=1